MHIFDKLAFNEDFINCEIAYEMLLDNLYLIYDMVIIDKLMQFLPDMKITVTTPVDTGTFTRMDYEKTVVSPVLQLRYFVTSSQIVWVHTQNGP